MNKHLPNSATTPFDAAAFLCDPDARIEFLRDALESGNAGYIANAREVVARAARRTDG